MSAPIASGGSGIYPATAELAGIPRWVCWKLERRKGQLAKVPYCVGGRSRASSTDPSTWSAFEDAWRSAFVDGDAAGIGVVVDGSDDLMGADLDRCIHQSGVSCPGRASWCASSTAIRSVLRAGPDCACSFAALAGRTGEPRTASPRAAGKSAFRMATRAVPRRALSDRDRRSPRRDTPETINFVEPDVIAELLARCRCEWRRAPVGSRPEADNPDPGRIAPPPQRGHGR